MKRFTFLVPVLVLFFGCSLSLLAQTQNVEAEELIGIDSSTMNLDGDIEIIIENIEPIEDVKIEMCHFITDVTAIEVPREEEAFFCCLIEQPAIFEGGMDNFYDIVTNQMRFSETMKEGRIFIQFVVDTTGKVSEMKVVKGLSEENDKEGLRIMNLINEHYTWKPAEQRGIKVKVKMCLPIVFKRKEKVKSNVEGVYER